MTISVMSPFQIGKTSDRSVHKVIERQLRGDYLRILAKLLQRGLKELISRIVVLKIGKRQSAEKAVENLPFTIGLRNRGRS
jgi:hypothetical protein